MHFANLPFYYSFHSKTQGNIKGAEFCKKLSSRFMRRLTFLLKAVPLRKYF